MPLIRQCRAHGCETLTMGQFCIEHEQPDRTLVRGQLFVTIPERAAATASPERRIPSVRTGSARPAAARHRR
jgi:hypothetical protein